MRVSGRDLTEKAALLERVNEDSPEGDLQICCKCVGAESER